MDSKGKILTENIYQIEKNSAGLQILQADDEKMLLFGVSSQEVTTNFGIFILTVQHDGQVLSGKKICGQSIGLSTVHVMRTSDGGVVMTGQTERSENNTSPNIYAIKLNKDLSLQWAKLYENMAYKQPSEIIESTNGDYLIVARINGNGENTPEVDGLILAVNKNGVLKTSYSVGGSKYDTISSFLKREQNELLLVGTTVSSGRGPCDAWILRDKTDNYFQVTSNPVPLFTKDLILQTMPLNTVQHDTKGYLISLPVGNVEHSEKSNEKEQTINKDL